MRGHRTLKSLTVGTAFAALLCSAAYSFSGNQTPTIEVAALTSDATQANLSSASPIRNASLDQAVANFVRGMSEGDAATVWLYASEEDQAAFETEQDTYSAFAEAFPALTEARDVAVERSWQEGDTPFVILSLKDGTGVAHEAEFGFWLDDAGDWKVVSGDIRPASTGQLASR